MPKTFPPVLLSQCVRVLCQQSDLQMVQRESPTSTVPIGMLEPPCKVFGFHGYQQSREDHSE